MARRTEAAPPAPRRRVQKRSKRGTATRGLGQLRRSRLRVGEASHPAWLQPRLVGWPSGFGLLFKATETQKFAIETNRNHARAQTRSPQGKHTTTHTSTSTTQISARKMQSKANFRKDIQNNANLHKQNQTTNKEHRKSTNKQGTPIKQITDAPRYRADILLKHVSTT